MINKENVDHTVKRFFEAIDSRYWKEFESTLADNVNVVIKSLEHETEENISKEKVTALWRDEYTEKYDKTIHIIGHIETVIRDNNAISTFDVDSTHFLGDKKWTGIESYIFFISIIDNYYKITDIDMTLHAVEGDYELRKNMISGNKSAGI